MNLVLWHHIEIADVPALPQAPDVPDGVSAPTGPPLTVTNDIYAGGLVLDAAVRVTMGEGATADTFSLTLTGLPAPSIAGLRSRHLSGGLRATVCLGYFDEPATRLGSRPVMTGRVTSVSTGIDAAGTSRTVIEGQEEGGYRLRNTPARLDRSTETPRIDLVTELLRAAGVALADGSTLPGSVPGIGIRAGSTLGPLQELADAADVPLVVRDGSVLLGAAVGREPAPVPIDPELNLVSRVDAQSEGVELPQPDGATPQGQATPPVHTGLDVVVLGHPGLRAGQQVTLTGLDDVPAGPLRIARVTHAYGAATGYTCALTLTAIAPGRRARATGGVEGVVDRWQDALARSRSDHPALDIGQVTAYTPGKDGRHLADLHYGQEPGLGVIAPSVTSPVVTDVELHGKPVAAPFAFHKVGLVTPVYPGMRAVLAHNRGMVDDAVVSGWLWSQQPRHEPPANEPGDHWLALPTELGPDGLPTGKGVNDLTDARGCRVVQARALRVQVGGERLPDVGVRPAVPSDDTVTIEHHTGTTIRISDSGEITVSTDQKTLTLTNGQVSVRLDGAKVAVS
ncbi:hypothetical protein ACFV9W_31445 [Streptomyces sp. NPDC059897]|uniref:hypothetical protein n=1 Tax=Streptomyces sp. NPDC059897 TaxID=3346994 RepID=UPI00365C860C